MASKGGCNKFDTPKPSGNNSSRMKPAQFARNNLAKGGVNKDRTNGVLKGK